MYLHKKQFHICDTISINILQHHYAIFKANYELPRLFSKPPYLSHSLDCLSRQPRAEAVGVVGGAEAPHVLILAGAGAVEDDAVEVFAVRAVQHVLHGNEPHSPAAAQYNGPR